MPDDQHFPANNLVPSIADERLVDFLATVADSSLDVAIESGALDGVPVVGIFTGLLKAYRGLSENWRIRKLAIFLSSVAEIPLEDRKAFSEQFQNERERDDFGGALLVLVDRAEDLEKPRVLGRLLAAHVAGVFGKEDLLRMSRMVDRCFFEDLKLLKEMDPGLPPSGQHIAASCLASVGFLLQIGLDGGEVGVHDGGIVYGFTPHAIWVANHGLGD